MKTALHIGKKLLITNALLGRDEYCMEYIHRKPKVCFCVREMEKRRG